MKLPSASTPRWIIVMIDLFIALVALLIAYLIRFDVSTNSDFLEKEWQILAPALPVFFVVKFAVFYFFQIHKGIVRHTSTQDIKRIFLAVLTCSVIFVALGLLRYSFVDNYFLFPSSVLFVEFLASVFLMISSRFAVKLLNLESTKNSGASERVLLYGAGVSGLITKRTIEKDTRLSYKIVGFLDSNKKISKNRLEGTTIYHTSKLQKLIDEEGVTLLIIAIQNPDKQLSKELVEICLKNNVKVQTVPSPKSWINGEFSTKQMKSIKIEDLLGRKPIELDINKIAEQLSGKRVLVTGAAGSIGSGLVKEISKFNPESIILLDQAESPLYDLQNDLLRNSEFSNYVVIIGDVRSSHRMERLFLENKPQVVFHAAAYKHVPLMEDNPSEAVLTNVKGSKNLVDCADKFGVEKFVMVSTDKAVNPTNVMGASKRIAEIYAQWKNNNSKTQFVTTRFGNVLGSNGSVIPLFRKQMEQGGPLTVTDPNVTRFFMTIPEACQLVLEAGTMGEGGEIFVFDMGESVKIIDLARKMIQLSGLEEGKDIEIKITGLRPGEKLYEELLANGENTLETYHPQILKAKIREENDEKMLEITALIDLFDNQENLDIVTQMKKLVPEFKSNNSIYSKLD